MVAMANKYKSSVNKIFSKHKLNGVVVVIETSDSRIVVRDYFNVVKVDESRFVNRFPTPVNLDDIEIISYYNLAIRGFYNYYKYAKYLASANL